MTEKLKRTFSGIIETGGAANLIVPGSFTESDPSLDYALSQNANTPQKNSKVIKERKPNNGYKLVLHEVGEVSRNSIERCN